MARIALLVALALVWPAAAPAEEPGDAPTAPEGWRQVPTELSRGSFSRVSGPEPREEAGTGEAPDEAGGPGVPASLAPEAGEAPEEAEADEEPPAPPRGATYGKACVYGADGEVLHAPPDKDCGGRSATPSTPAQPVRRGGPSDNHCIYGHDGRVIHRPDDASC